MLIKSVVATGRDRPIICDPISRGVARPAANPNFRILCCTIGTWQVQEERGSQQHGIGRLPSQAALVTPNQASWSSLVHLEYDVGLNMRGYRRLFGVE
jgi:hypothetical protein